MKRHRHDTDRGFVLLVALGMVAIVGVAILALASLTSYDGSRTVKQIREAQLEQMLLAGAAEAPAHLSSTPSPVPGQSWKLALPAELQSRDGRLEAQIVSMPDDKDVTLIIHATLDAKTIGQTLRCARGDDGWTITSAQLGTD